MGWTDGGAVDFCGVGIRSEEASHTAGALSGTDGATDPLGTTGKSDRAVLSEGRPPYPLGVMLRVHCVQLFYNLSDPGMEDLLYEAESVRRFVGLRLTDALPDETTILNFRHLLEKHDLGEGLFGAINAHLASCGHRMKQGTIVDATLIEAPSSTKNRRQERDPEMHQTRKGNQWHFGMKAHIGVDATSGLTHRVATTAAHASDLAQGTPAVTRRRDGGVGRCGISRHRQTSGVPGIEGGLAGGDASGGAPPTGTGRPCEDAREGQGFQCVPKWSIRSCM